MNHELNDNDRYRGKQDDKSDPESISQIPKQQIGNYIHEHRIPPLKVRPTCFVLLRGCIGVPEGGAYVVRTGRFLYCIILMLKSQH